MLMDYRSGKRWSSFLAASWLILCSTSAFAAYPGPEPLPVVAGGTGAQTLTANAVLIGAGTAAVAFVAPSATAGVGLVSAGAGSNPVFGTTVVGGGGTGLTTVTAHALVVGEGASNFAVVGPTADSVVVWGSASSDPTTAGTSATADSVLAWAAAGTTPAALSVNNCTGGSNALTYATSSHAFGCNSISAGGAVAPNILSAAGPFTLSSTYGVTNISRMGTPAAATYNLPSAVTVGSGWRGCLKDDTTNFQTNNATVKSPTAGSIDGIAGATGIVMNIARQELCFLSDGSNFFIE